ncbi:hypothetical protein ACQPU1_17420 [Clostridium paraputrificum]|uniref:hypothetical protein n=1 Tax=Clostridium paraputrificum TaxID=29363 RepID=UPI003D3477DA
MNNKLNQLASLILFALILFIPIYFEIIDSDFASFCLFILLGFFNFLNSYFEFKKNNKKISLSYSISGLIISFYAIFSLI